MKKKKPPFLSPEDERVDMNLFPPNEGHTQTGTGNHPSPLKTAKSWHPSFGIFLL